VVDDRRVLMVSLRRARSAAPLLLGAFGAQAGLLVTGIVSARLLGVEGRGLLSAATFIAYLFSFLGALGTPYLMRLLVAEGGSPRLVLAGGMRAATMPSVCGAALGTAATWLLTRDVGVAALAGASIIPMVAVQQLVGIEQGAARYWSAAVLQLAGPFLFAIGLVAGILALGASVEVALLGWNFSTWGGWLVAAVLVRRSFSKSTPKSWERPPTTSTLLRRGFQGLASTYSPLESLRIDQLFVVVTLGTTSLGLYVTALAFSNIARLLGQAAGAVVPRLVAQEHGARRSIRLILLGCLGVGVVMAAVAPLLVVPVFGPEFADGRTLAVPLCLAGGLMSARTLLTEVFRTQRREHLASRIELGALAVYTMAMVVFAVVGSGLLAAAVALLLATLVSTSLMYRLAMPGVSPR
jgi:O-antigen/teichoic acid export membrane protein